MTYPGLYTYPVSKTPFGEPTILLLIDPRVGWDIKKRSYSSSWELGATIEVNPESYKDELRALQRDVLGHQHIVGYISKLLNEPNPLKWVKHSHLVANCNTAIDLSQVECVIDKAVFLKNRATSITIPYFLVEDLIAILAEYSKELHKQPNTV